jgi:anti-anti-sigma regulatory factor
MSSNDAKLFVFASSQLACVKIQGKANFVTIIEFKDLLGKILVNGFKCLVLDLSECSVMDSTFLGALSGYCLRLKNEALTNPNQPSRIELLNPNERVIESIESLGILHMFRVLQADSADSPIKEIEFSENISTSKPSREEVTLNCLEAHKLLMELNPANVAKFKDVAKFLADDLKRIQGNQPPTEPPPASPPNPPSP